MVPETEYEKKFYKEYGKELEKLVDQKTVREKYIKSLKNSINAGVKYEHSKFIAELKDDFVGNILEWSGRGHVRRTKEDAKESLIAEILLAKGIYVANPPKSTTCGTESVAPSMSSHRTTNTQKNSANMDPPWYPIGGVRPRKYQEECVEKIINEGNMLINLDTGMGKTLIASMVTNWMLESKKKDEIKKKKCVAMFVPTRALVTQQMEYLKKHCHINGKPIDQQFVKEVAGMQIEDWDKHMWREAIDGARILVGTPEPFRKAMCEYHFIIPQDFSLLIFDEAHHCIRNSPMANILRRVQEEEQRYRPLHLGLTGSWLNGRLSNADEKLNTLLKLMDAKMHVPNIPEEYKKDEATYTKVEYLATNKENDHDIEELVVKVTEEVISGLSAICKEVEKSTKRSLKVFNHLGVEGWLFFLEHALLNEVICQSKNAAKSGKFETMARSKIKDVEYLKFKLKDKIIPQQKDHIDKIKKFGAPLSGKATKLVELIQDLSREEEYRIIVFVEEISISLPLQKILNEHVEEINCTSVTGVNSMDDETRLANIRRFKEGAYKIMVATASLEEGLDVSACNHVISFDSIATVKSHVQKSGRARAKDAQIWYFENDPEMEKLRANEMQRCAKNIKKSDTEYTMNCYTDLEFPFGHYPFKDHSNGMTVTLLTAKQTFHEYIQAVVKQQLNPYEALYKFDGEKRLQKLLIPTPKGVFEVSEKTIRDMWGMTLGKDPSNLAILHPDCKPKKGGWEEKQYVMTAVIMLVQKGFIGDNKASNEAKYETMLHDECKKLIPENTKMRFRNQYNVNAFAHAQGKFRTGDGKGKNAREQLLEMVQKMVKVTDRDNIRFETDATPDRTGFLSRVIILGSETYAGMEPRQTKKEAEEDAAFIAVEYLRNSGSSAKDNNDETDGKTFKNEDDDIDEKGDKISKKNDHIDEAPTPSRFHLKEQKEPDEEPDKTPISRISEGEENSACRSPRTCSSLTSKKKEKEQEAPQDTFHSCHESSTGLKEEENKSRNDGGGASTVASLIQEMLPPVRSQNPPDLDAAESSYSAPLTSVSRRAPPSSAASSKRPKLIKVKLVYGEKSQKVKTFKSTMTIKKILEEFCPKDLKGKEVRMYHNDIELHGEIEIGDISDDAELYGEIDISLEFREHADSEDDW